MFTIVGLGNLGSEYERTRHNAGFTALDYLHDEFGANEWEKSKYGKCELATGVVFHEEVLLVKPLTMMNRSGETLQFLKKDHNLSSRDVILVHDELDLPIGTFKLSFARNAGGHNGVESVIEALDTNEFLRIRIGVSPVGSDGRALRPTEGEHRSYVLSNFLSEEYEAFEKIFPQIKKTVEAVIREGREAAMNRFN